MASPDSQSRVMTNPKRYQKEIAQFFNRSEMSDVVVKVGTEKYYAHKFVLAKSSDVFRTMLYDRNWNQSHENLPEIVLEETEECQNQFEAYLRYLYTAEVTISVESAVGILCLADKYNEECLKDLCIEYMVEHARAPNLENALRWYVCSKSLHARKLTKQCLQTLTWNANVLINSPLWLDTDLELVKDLLANKSLVVQNEYSLFQAVEKWLKSDSHVEHYTNYAKELLPLIRFAQMQLSDLCSVDESEIAKNDELRPLLDRLTSKAHKFRSICSQKLKEGMSFDEPLYCPRNYLDLSVHTGAYGDVTSDPTEITVKTPVGPVPITSREGEWTVTLRKLDNDLLKVEMTSLAPSLFFGEDKAQGVLVLTNSENRVVYVEEEAIQEYIKRCEGDDPQKPQTITAPPVTTPPVTTPPVTTPAVTTPAVTTPVVTTPPVTTPPVTTPPVRTPPVTTPAAAIPTTTASTTGTSNNVHYKSFKVIIKNIPR